MALFEHERFACSKKATSIISVQPFPDATVHHEKANLACFEKLFPGLDFGRLRRSDRAADDRTRWQIKNHRSSHFRFNDSRFSRSSLRSRLHILLLIHHRLVNDNSVWMCKYLMAMVGLLMLSMLSR